MEETETFLAALWLPQSPQTTLITPASLTPMPKAGLWSPVTFSLGIYSLPGLKALAF